MPLKVNDKLIDRRLNDLKNILRNDFNITNCSKTDALRFLLRIKKQGKKTHRRWKEII